MPSYTKREGPVREAEARERVQRLLVESPPSVTSLGRRSFLLRGRRFAIKFSFLRTDECSTILFPLLLLRISISASSSPIVSLRELANSQTSFQQNTRRFCGFPTRVMSEAHRRAVRHRRPEISRDITVDQRRPSLGNLFSCTARTTMLERRLTHTPAELSLCVLSL